MSRKISACTAPKAEVVSLTWKIENFSQVHCGHKTAVPGPTFSLPTNPESSWQSFVDVYERRTKEDYLYYRAQLLNYSGLVFSRINYELAIIASDQSTTKRKIKSFIIGKSAKNYIHIFIGFICDLKAKRQLHDDILTLECSFSVIQGAVKEDEVSNELSSKSLSCLSENFEALYLSKSFSDFTIIVENSLFSVHKCVLAARSPIFSAMLHGETVETLNNQLEIQDFDANTVEIMLLYLYTGQLNHLSSEMYLKLYLASDKYLILSLKKICSIKLIKNLSVGNVCDIYVVAYYHYDSTLKSAAKKFLFANISKIMCSDNWKKLVLENNQLAADLLKEAGIL